MTDLYAPDLTVFTNVFTHMSILGSVGILGLIMGFLGIVIITRDVEKWKLLVFPMMTTIWMMGIPLGGLGMLMLLFGIILFAVEILSTGVIGNVIHGINEGVKRGGSGVGKVFRGIGGGTLGLSRIGRGKIEKWERKSKDKRLEIIQTDRTKVLQAESKLKMRQYAKEQKKLREEQLRQFNLRRKTELFNQRQRNKISKMQEKFYKLKINKDREYIPINKTQKKLGKYKSYKLTKEEEKILKVK